ncbi:hypothetical protein PoB_001076700 [Plakobranchus ocellatus]|uniref:Uncharacterized protein n=1 Tax=Plakobranchus ocellatus TaxID=259542 RepID=A0AAV3YQ56_9GAST|nr:hypothetical protein PoB_001076700 [Plakobranchus ocellatus]
MCIQYVQISTRGRQFGKISEYAHKRSNSQHGIGESARLPNVHTSGTTLSTGEAIWQDFRICTQNVQLSTRYRQFGKTSECAHKRSNSQHGTGNLARLPNMHTKCPTLHSGKGIWRDFRICTKEVQLSTRYRQLGKTSESTRKRSNSQHGTGIWQDFRMCTEEVQLSTLDS